MTEQGRHGGRDVRRERRVPTDLAATIGPRRCAAARVVDLSLAGCLLRCETALDAGEVLDLQLDLPDGPLRVKARVADASLDGAAPPGTARSLAGLEFLGLAAADEPRLRGFLEAEARRSAVLTKPLREVDLRALRALLDEEAAHWDAELFWDFGTVRAAVAGGIERGTLGGRVIGDGSRAFAYSYYLADAGRVILGSIYCGREHRARGLEEALVEAVVGDARRERGCGRVECQTLFCTDHSADARASHPKGFASRPRHYMLLDLQARRPAPPPPPPAGLKLRPMQRHDLHAAAEIVYRSHVGTLDAALNLTYATPSACRGFVDTLVLRAGCGRFDSEASRILEGPRGPVGVLIASRLSRTNGHICQVSVVPEAQRRGLGLLLMAHALHGLDRQGLATATLSVTVENAAAHRLYTVLGFRTRREFAAHAWARPPGRVDLPGRAAGE